MINMGKIAQVSVKYNIHATLDAEGLIDKPDIIGAIFGQTEGLLGKEMELRELQKNGRIGRIDVDTTDKNGKTTAKIRIPSSLDKTQTAIIAAAIETIERIGPSNGKITLDKIEDVRSDKRDYIQERAKEILSRFIKEADNAGEMAREVSTSVREGEATSYGPDGLTAGPDVASSDEVILVEGRADVLALIRAGINNAVGVNGTSVPRTAVDLMKDKKVITAFVDGDRGGDLIIKALSQVGRIDFVAKAPDGKEVEELMSKEIIKCLRNKIPYAPETTKREYENRSRDYRDTKDSYENRSRDYRDNGERPVRRSGLKPSEREFFAKSFSELTGSSKARLYDADLKLLGEVTVKDLVNVKGIGEVYAVIADASVNDDLLYAAQNNHAKILLGNSIETRKRSRVKVLTKETLY